MRTRRRLGTLARRTQQPRKLRLRQPSRRMLNHRSGRLVRRAMPRSKHSDPCSAAHSRGTLLQLAHLAHPQQSPSPHHNPRFLCVGPISARASLGSTLYRPTYRTCSYRRRTDAYAILGTQRPRRKLRLRGRRPNERASSPTMRPTHPAVRRPRTPRRLPRRDVDLIYLL